MCGYFFGRISWVHHFHFLHPHNLPFARPLDTIWEPELYHTCSVRRALRNGESAQAFLTKESVRTWGDRRRRTCNWARNCDWPCGPGKLDNYPGLCIPWVCRRKVSLQCWPSPRRFDSHKMEMSSFLWVRYEDHCNKPQWCLWGDPVGQKVRLQPNERRIFY